METSPRLRDDGPPTARDRTGQLFAAPVAPTMIGQYPLAERIGEGGMGQVYRATRTDGQFAHDVAIKIATFKSHAAGASLLDRSPAQRLQLVDDDPRDVLAGEGALLARARGAPRVACEEPREAGGAWARAASGGATFPGAHQSQRAWEPRELATCPPNSP